MTKSREGSKRGEEKMKAKRCFLMLALSITLLLSFTSKIYAAFTSFGGNVGSSKTVVCNYTIKANSSKYTTINWYSNPSGVSMTMHFYETSLDGSTNHAYASTTGTSGYFYVSTTCIQGNGVILKASQGGIGKPSRYIGGTWEP